MSNNQDWIQHLEYTQMRLEKAALTLRLLPDKERSCLRHKSMSWPQSMQEWFAGCLDHDSKAKAMIRPSMRDIDHMDEMLEIMRVFSSRTDKEVVALGRVLWAVSSGAPYRAIERMPGMPSKSTIKRWYDLALDKVAAELYKRMIKKGFAIPSHAVA